MSKLSDAGRWELLAEEAMTIAQGMRNPEARRMMLGVAEDYHALARQAEMCARRMGIEALQPPAPATQSFRF